jgi:hypothetical protein
MFYVSRDVFHNGVRGYGIRQDKVTEFVTIVSWVADRPKIKSRLFTLIRSGQLSHREIVLECTTKDEAEIALKAIVASDRLDGRDVFIRNSNQ